MGERLRHATPRRWDLFCRVVDNLGDAGVCWRLARQLVHEHGLRVRLWIDDPDALARLKPGAGPGGLVEGVRVETWRADDPRLAASTTDDVADVVVDAFACSLPPAYRAAMRARRPVWINLEYLSAEDWVATHHGLPSPKPDGLIEHFFFPGFGDASPDARDRFLASIGVRHAPGGRLASLFCYPEAPAGVLLDALAARREGWRVLVPVGVAPSAASHPIAVAVPFVPQSDYDALLWCCDLNFVRGEDSMVRALWAARPMVWQAYRQEADAHRPKVDAWLRAWARDAAPTEDAAAALTAVHACWNAPAEHAAVGLPAALDALVPHLADLRDAALRWTRAEGGRPDLATRLVGFARSRL